jgi:hypothetical protein
MERAETGDESKRACAPLRIAYFTICARNYFAHALTLRASLLEASPDAAFFIFLADEGDVRGENVVLARNLATPDFWGMAFRYNVIEFCTALKPYAFKHLFDELGFAAAIYLDPDVQVFRPLTHACEALCGGYDAVLTPHLTAPLEDGMSPSTFDILRCGGFNLGFAALADRPDVRIFLDWWGRQCLDKCLLEPERGLFVDQRFADLAPHFIPRTKVLRHRGYNVAYWNLPERPIQKAKGEWTAGGELLHFLHFSGFRPEDRRSVSQHQNRYFADNVGAAAALFEDYRRRLNGKGYAEWTIAPYAYGLFSDGVAIPPPARRALARMLAAPRHAESIFAPRHDDLNAPSSAVDQDAGVPITVLMYEAWRQRSAIQERYPLSTRVGRRGFAEWFLAFATSELGIDPVFVGVSPSVASPTLQAALSLRRIVAKLPGPVRGVLRAIDAWSRSAAPPSTSQRAPALASPAE